MIRPQNGFSGHAYDLVWVEQFSRKLDGVSAIKIQYTPVNTLIQTISHPLDTQYTKSLVIRLVGTSSWK